MSGEDSNWEIRALIAQVSALGATLKAHTDTWQEQDRRAVAAQAEQDRSARAHRQTVYERLAAIDTAVSHTREQSGLVATAAAEQAVKRVFLMLGTDVDDAKSVLELQTTLAHSRRWRRAIEQVQRVGIMSAMGTIVLGLLGLLWLGFKQKVGGG